MKKKKSRRKFIQKSSQFITGMTAYNIYSNIFENIISNQVKSAVSAPLSDKVYVSLLAAGGPSRWMWDLFLCPYSTKNLKTNPQMITKFIKNGSDRYLEGEYALIKRKGINVPYLWQFDVPAPNGVSRPMTDLLDNLLVLQGISTNNAAHRGSIKAHANPPGSNQSMSAIASDSHNKTLNTVALGAGHFYFNSSKGLSPIILKGQGQILNKIQDAFALDKQSNIFFNKKLLNSSLKTTSNILNQYAKSDSAKNSEFEKVKKSTNKLLEQSFDDISSYWQPAFEKYNSLINRCLFNSVIPGINNAPIGNPNISQRDNIDKRHQIADRASAVKTTHQNLINLIDEKSNINILAENFAALEYLLVNDLSSSISAVVPGIRNLHLGNGKYQFQGKDEHGGGALSVAYINTVFYRALSACLLELFTQLKNKNLFSKVVFDVSSEFNRKPLKNMRASDHGWEGKSIAIYSGSIKGPLILGNTIIDKDLAVDASWGKGNGSVGLADMTSTLAYLLNAPSPISSVKSAVTIDSSGNMTNHITKTKIIS